MQVDWLTATTYQITERLITLINDFLIGLKLEARGIRSPQVMRRMQSARTELDRTFAHVQRLVAENTISGQSVTGAGTALCHLARNFTPDRNFPSAHLPVEALSRVRELLQKNDSDTQELVGYLSSLRGVIEQRMAPDVRDIMGQV